MNIAYIYRLKTKEGLIYLGSHLVKKGKTIYTDNYCGSSQDQRLKNVIVSKEILCFIKGKDRKEVFKKIQLLEHKLIIKLDCINKKEYANATSMGVIGINYKRLGAIASNEKQKQSSGYKELRTRAGKLGAKATQHIRTTEWHSKGGQTAGRKLRSHWCPSLYNKVKLQMQLYPNKKGCALWTSLGKPTKSYKTIQHMYECINKGLSFEQACSG